MAFRWLDDLINRIIDKLEIEEPIRTYPDYTITPSKKRTNIVEYGKCVSYYSIVIKEWMDCKGLKQKLMGHGIKIHGTWSTFIFANEDTVGGFDRAGFEALEHSVDAYELIVRIMHGCDSIEYVGHIVSSHVEETKRIATNC